MLSPAAHLCRESCSLLAAAWFWTGLAYNTEELLLCVIGKSEAETCGSQQTAAPAAKRPQMSTTAWSHHMAGDARPSLDLRGVFLNEMNSTLPEIPPRNTPGAHRHIIKFIVILLEAGK